MKNVIIDLRKGEKISFDYRSDASFVNYAMEFLLRVTDNDCFVHTCNDLDYDEQIKEVIKKYN